MNEERPPYTDPEELVQKKSAIFNLLCKANGLTTGAQLNWHPDSLCQAGSLLNCMHQKRLVWKQEELVQAAATLNGMWGFSEIHAQDSSLNPCPTERIPGWLMKEASGLSWHTVNSRNKVCRALLHIQFLLAQQIPLVGEKIKWMMILNRLVLSTDCYNASLGIKGVILLMN